MPEYTEIKSMLKDEKTELKELQNKLRVSLKNAPEGKLHVSKRKGKGPEYYAYLSRENRNYISKKNRGQAYALAQKEYNQDLLKQADKRIQAIQKMEEAYNEPLSEVFNSFDPVKQQLIIPYKLSDEEFVKRWFEKHPGLTNNYPITTNYYSNQGIPMRSKSEKIIADLFEKNEVPYVYEPRITLRNGRSICPDFLVLNLRLRKTYVYEHFGLMSDGQYSEKVGSKITELMLDGYMPGINFLFSMESTVDPLNTRIVEKIIDTYLK